MNLMDMIKMWKLYLVMMTSLLRCHQCSVCWWMPRGKGSPWLSTKFLLDGNCFLSSNTVLSKLTKLRICFTYLAMYFKKNKPSHFNISRSRLSCTSLAPHQGGLVKTKSSKASCWCGSDKAKCEKAVLRSEDQVKEVFEALLSEEVCQTKVSRSSISIYSFAKGSIKKKSMSDLQVGRNKPSKNSKLVTFCEMKNVFKELSMTWFTCKCETHVKVQKEVQQYKPLALGPLLMDKLMLKVLKLPNTNFFLFMECISAILWTVCVQQK